MTGNYVNCAETSSSFGLVVGHAGCLKRSSFMWCIYIINSSQSKSEQKCRVFFLAFGWCESKGNCTFLIYLSTFKYHFRWRWGRKVLDFKRPLCYKATCVTLHFRVWQQLSLRVTGALVNDWPIPVGQYTTFLWL